MSRQESDYSHAVTLMSESVETEVVKDEKTSDRFLISDLCDLVGTYMSEDQVKQVYDAYLFGAQAHEGQIRISGEPYIYHPIAVARILAEMHMDVKSIVASILHDVLEDTAATRKLIAREFGDGGGDAIGTLGLDESSGEAAQPCEVLRSVAGADGAAVLVPVPIQDVVMGLDAPMGSVERQESGRIGALRGVVGQPVDDLGGRLAGLLVDAQALNGEGLANEGEIQTLRAMDSEAKARSPR